MATSSTTFHDWLRLPTELQVVVLEHALQYSIGRLRSTPLYHQWYMKNFWTFGRAHCTISICISTRNHEFVELALHSCEYRGSVENVGC